jgi:anti-sigma B factor antagonist
MALNCVSREIGDVTVLELSGLLSLGGPYASGPESGLVLGEHIRELIEKGHTKIVLNLAGVRFVDSSGAGQLAGAFTTARNRDAELKIAHPTSQVRSLLRVTRLDSLFDIHEDEQSAIAAFAKSAAAGA